MTSESITSFDNKNYSTATNRFLIVLMSDITYAINNISDHDIRRTRFQIKRRCL
jgi:hypothetical protein